MNKQKKIIAAGSVGAGLVAVQEPANAALNAGISTGLTGLQTDALALVDLVWPVAIAVTVAFILLGLFKKAASKAV
jgi:hypothetical protein